MPGTLMPLGTVTVKALVPLVPAEKTATLFDTHAAGASAPVESVLQNGLLRSHEPVEVALVPAAVPFRSQYRLAPCARGDNAATAADDSAAAASSRARRLLEF